MTDEAGDPGPEVIDQAEALAVLAALFAGDGPDFDEIAGPLHWPTVSSGEASKHWAELRRWVERLIERFPHLDHHVIPLCWWRHNGHVEALVALRDHERMCYSNSSPPSAGLEWHRGFRDIEARLREWTSTIPCGSQHDPRTHPERRVDEDEWATFLADDTASRLARQPGPPAGDDTPPEPDDTPPMDGEPAP